VILHLLYHFRKFRAEIEVLVIGDYKFFDVR
jgi:hypothetical protein